MFYEAELRAFLHIKPKDFCENLSQEVMNELSKRYVNKIVALPYGSNNDVSNKSINKSTSFGLCVTISRIISINEKQTYPSDAGSYLQVLFSLILFKPYKSEIIKGQILDCDHSGLTISIGFFDTIFVKIDELPQPCKYDSIEERFIYKPKNVNKLTIEVNDNVYVKVLNVKFLPFLKNNNNSNNNNCKNNSMRVCGFDSEYHSDTDNDTINDTINDISDNNNTSNNNTNNTNNTTNNNIGNNSTNNIDNCVNSSNNNNNNNNNNNDVNSIGNNIDNNDIIDISKEKGSNDGDIEMHSKSNILFKDVMKHESMTVYATMKESGLGPCGWWDENEDE